MLPQNVASWGSECLKSQELEKMAEARRSESSPHPCIFEGHKTFM